RLLPGGRHDSATSQAHPTAMLSCVFLTLPLQVRYLYTDSRTIRPGPARCSCSALTPGFLSRRHAMEKKIVTVKELSDLQLEKVAAGGDRKFNSSATATNTNVNRNRGRR